MNEKFTFTAKVNNDNLETIIKNAGIQYPHESLGFFKSIYASIDDKANKNGVRLASSVANDIGRLVGCQCNFEHIRVGHICGTILHAFVNDNEEIEIVFSFYRTVYPNEYEYALELMNAGELNVSFELRVDKKDIEYLNDGTKRLHAVSFDGVGLLLENPPAYPNAHVYQNANINELHQQDLVFAKCFKGEDMIQQFEGNHWTAKYINSLPDTSFAVIEPSYLEGKSQDKRARHLPYKDHNGNVNDAHYRFALRKIDKIQTVTDSITKEELIDTAQNVLNNVDILFNKEDKKVDKKANEALLAKQKESVIAEFGEEAVKGWTDEDYQSDEKIQALRDSIKSSKEEEKVEDAGKKGDCGGTPKVGDKGDKKPIKKKVIGEDKPAEAKGEDKPAEAKVEDKPAEAKVEDKPTDVTADSSDVTTDLVIYDVTYKDDGSMEIVETIISERKVDGKIVKEEKIVRQTVYAQEKVNEITADFEAQLVAKDEEIETIKVSAKTVAELRAELKDYAKDLSDEDLCDKDKVKIAKLTKELAEAKSNKEELTLEEEKDVETASTKEEETKLETGHDDTIDDGRANMTAYIKKRHASVTRK